MPRRENRGRRRVLDAIRRTILVYCGADRTEPDYFDGLRRRFRDSGVTIKVRRQGVDPVTLVRSAAAYLERKPGSFDEVWCVVDVDQYDIAAATAEARRLGIGLAVSNPCFEVWLLLHHVDCHAYCNGPPDVERRLKKHVSAYDKTELEFGKFADGVHDAVKRAKSLDPTGKDHTRNPSTNVWQVVEQVVGGRMGTGDG